MKKILAIIISLILAFSCMTTSAVAFDANETLSAALPLSNNISALADVVETLWTQIIVFLQDITSYIKNVFNPGVKLAEPDIAVAPKLIPASNSVVIDRENNIIYGLSPRLKAEKINNYISVENNGRIEIEYARNGYFKPCVGTGSVIHVIDNATNETVESFNVIIFGDVNGDSTINATDASMVDDEANNITSWSNTLSNDYSPYMTIAADIDKDGIVSEADGNIIACHAVGAVSIDQHTGTLNN